MVISNLCALAAMAALVVGGGVEQVVLAVAGAGWSAMPCWPFLGVTVP